MFVYIYISSRIFENVTLDLLRRTVFFGQKSNSKVAIIKTKSATTAFFFFSSSLPPRSFFFFFHFPSLVWFWSLSGPKSLPFDSFSLKWYMKVYTEERKNLHYKMFIGFIGSSAILRGGNCRVPAWKTKARTAKIQLEDDKCCLTNI